MGKGSGCLIRSVNNENFSEEPLKSGSSAIEEISQMVYRSYLFNRKSCELRLQSRCLFFNIYFILFYCFLYNLNENNNYLNFLLDLLIIIYIIFIMTKYHLDYLFFIVSFLFILLLKYFI